MLEKPPLGISPTWYVLPKRMEEISEAITRYSRRQNKDIPDFEVIQKWSAEIYMLCDICKNDIIMSRRESK